MNNFNELRATVKSDLDVAQTRAYEELRTLWEKLRETPMGVIPPEVLKEGANGTGYYDGLLTIKTPMSVMYKGVDEFGRMVICWCDGGCRQQVVFDRYGERNGMLISQRNAVPSIYLAEEVLYLLRQAVANAWKQDDWIPFPTQLSEAA